MNFTIALFSSLSLIFLIGVGMGVFQFREQVKNEKQFEIREISE